MFLLSIQNYRGGQCMIVGLLQLSDIHIEAQNNSILSKHDKIPWALQEYIYQLDHLFIIITGDSAFSGREIEYLQVMQMIDNIKKIYFQ